MTKYLLVGSQFCQGAPAVLAHGLPQRSPVRLEAEPDNPYDALAVRVYVARAEVRDSPALAEALAGFGQTLDDAPEEILLGHLGASDGTKPAKAARAAGLTVKFARDWHIAAPPSGRLTFEGCGVITIETQEK